jgi:hypothetical protein
LITQIRRRRRKEERMDEIRPKPQSRFELFGQHVGIGHLGATSHVWRL